MTTIDRDELRFAAEAHLEFGGGGDELANGVLALLDALTRAGAQTETRRQQTKYWKVRAEVFEAKMNELDRAYISEHGQRRRAEAEQDRLKDKLARRSETASRLLEERNNAEARIQAVRDVLAQDGADQWWVQEWGHHAIPFKTIRRALDAP